MVKALKKVLVASWLALVVVVLLSGARALAATAPPAFSYATEVRYKVLDNTTTQVSELYTITNNTARQYLTELQLTTPSDKISDLSVSYLDGAPIATKIVAQNSADSKFAIATQKITMRFGRINAGLGQTWQFKVSYKSQGLIETKGSAHTVYVPAVDTSDGRDSYTITVDAPQDFGRPHFTGSSGHLQQINDGRQSYVFTRDDVSKHSLALVFGDTTIYDLNFNFPLNNDSPVARTFTVTLPPELGTQSSVVQHLKPQPTATRLDADGNVLADFVVGPHQHTVVTTDIQGKARYRDYDISKSGKRNDIPSDLVANYTKSTHYWQTDGAVAAAASSVVKPDATVATNVQAVYRYVIDHLTYNSEKIKFNVRQGADKALANPNNVVCLEYADLMIAMLRSQGIPARMLVGYAYSGSLKASPAVADSLHAWVEAYVPGVGWMSVDPTWGEKFDEFGHADLDHFAFAVWGRNDNAPASVMLGNTDTGYQYENTSLKFSSASTSVVPGGSLHVSRYTLLPFVSLDYVTVIAQPKIVSTGNVLQLDNRTVKLGSLAPSQRASFSVLTFGSNWNRGSPVQLERPIDGQLTLLAKTSVRVNYWPMLSLPLLILLIWLIGILRLRRKQRASRVRTMYNDYSRKRNMLDDDR